MDNNYFYVVSISNKKAGADFVFNEIKEVLHFVEMVLNHTADENDISVDISRVERLNFV